MAHRLLDREAFQRARHFILHQARPLEQAQFRLHFGNASASDAESDPAPEAEATGELNTDSAVVDALTAFQNADGGFGNALEPDLRLPDSSPMVTSEAFVVLRELEASSGADVRRRGVRYLLDTLDPSRPGWQDVPPAVNDHAYVQWWQRADPEQPDPKALWGNPDADLIGALHDHESIVPASLLAELTELALAKLEACREIPPYVARCYLRLARAAPSASAAIMARLCRDVDRIMDQIDGSSIQVFWLAETPEGLFAAAAAERVQESLDAEIERQSPDGCWKPRWTWFGNYPEVWEVAEKEWSGQQTLLTLRSLRAWGRIPSFQPA